MVLAIVGGIMIARYGFQLYRDGAGLGRDHASFLAGPLKLNARSVGSVVMATSFLWVWAGVKLSPNLEKKAEEIRIYSFVTPNGNLTTPALVTNTLKESSALRNNPEELSKLLQKAVSKSNQKETGPTTELNGKAASIDPSSVEVSKSPSGELLLLTKVRSGTESATVVYEPKIGEGEIVFAPSSFGRADERKETPNHPGLPPR